MDTLRKYWYGWKTSSPDEKKELLNTSSFSNLVHTMYNKARIIYAEQMHTRLGFDYQTKGFEMATKLCDKGSEFWADFDEGIPHRLMKFQYAKLPKEYHDIASKIVIALNKIKEGAWAYAFCITDMPEYEAHPLRGKIIQELSCEANTYDTAATMIRAIIQLKMK